MDITANIRRSVQFEDVKYVTEVGSLLIIRNALQQFNIQIWRLPKIQQLKDLRAQYYSSLIDTLHED